MIGGPPSAYLTHIPSLVARGILRAAAEACDVINLSWSVPPGPGTAEPITIGGTIGICAGIAATESPLIGLACYVELSEYE